MGAKPNKIKKLTTRDLLERQRNSDGYGLYGHEVRSPVCWLQADDPYLATKTLDETIVQVANKLKFDAERLFEFMNSKLGRWAGDELASGFEMREVILEKYMTKFSTSGASRE
jgi:hypothetical protein